MYQKYIKRLIDIVVSLAGLILAWWLYAIIALAIYIDDPGPVIFKQKRVGKGKTHFNLYKFRSMKLATPHDMPTHLLENPDQWILRSGKFIRHLSLDEIVQLVNILKGEGGILGTTFGSDDITMICGC